MDTKTVTDCWVTNMKKSAMIQCADTPQQSSGYCFLPILIIYLLAGYMYLFIEAK